jgi:hypothetical protein
MKETIGNRVGVYRRKIPLLRAAILFALIFAMVTVITEPLVGMQEFKEHVRRLAGEGHPFTRLLYEPDSTHDGALRS